MNASEFNDILEKRLSWIGGVDLEMKGGELASATPFLKDICRVLLTFTQKSYETGVKNALWFLMLLEIEFNRNLERRGAMKLSLDYIRNNRIMQTRKVLGVKAAEYAYDNDRFHNFKKAASFLNVTPMDALVGFLTKHLVSLDDLALRLADLGIVSDPIQIGAQIDEKIGDAFNYVIISEAIAIDAFQHDREKNS